jgi:glycosyltransferase involved in cell wall biosynthesis
MPPLSGSPLVSVVMAVYNGADFISDSIASVLAQTHDRLDLIIVDDGSTDATLSIVEHWMTRDRRVRLLKRPHLGHAQALNAGISIADGAFIARIDHDDLWHKRKLEIQLPFMLQREVDVCGSWVRRFGTATGVIRFAQSHEAIRYETLFACPILDSATLFRGDLLRAHPYPPEAIVRQELTQCVRLLPAFRFANLSRYLCDYRVHPGQKTQRFVAMVRHRHASLCREHFLTMFPDASADDIATFIRICASSTASLNRAELAAAGQFFVRYLHPEHQEAKQRMRRRWRRLCRFGCLRSTAKTDVFRDTLARLQ